MTWDETAERIRCLKKINRDDARKVGYESLLCLEVFAYDRKGGVEYHFGWLFHVTGAQENKVGATKVGPTIFLKGRRMDASY